MSSPWLSVYGLMVDPGVRASHGEDRPFFEGMRRCGLAYLDVERGGPDSTSAGRRRSEMAANHFVGLLLWIPIKRVMFTGATDATSDAELAHNADAACLL